MPPPDPSSTDLRIAADLLRGTTRSIDEIAAASHLTERTLRRRFEEETGRSPRGWRTAHRLVLAEERLRAGRRLADVAPEAGYGSGLALRRALEREQQRCAAIGGVSRRDPGGIVPTGSWPRRNGFHVAIWAATGASELGIDGVVHAMPPGTVLWAPAGSLVSLRMPAGSTALPLGWCDGGEPPPPLRIGARGVDELLRIVTESYSGVRPVDPASAVGIAALRCDPAPIGVARDGISSDAVLDAARALRNALVADPAAPWTLEGWARRSGIAAEALRTEFLAVTGVDPQRWRHGARMAAARRDLGSGLRVAEVAHRVGYRSAPSFSRAFRRAHGVSPSRYQEAELAARSARAR